jgi:hypothetical protein
MNNNTQSKNGFATFLATLVISLAVFGVIYYLITDFSDTVDIEKNAANEIAAAEEHSAFGELSRQKVKVPQKAVLSGADESTEDPPEATESTVPDTGSSGMFVAATIASITLVAGIAYIMKGPRKLALSEFENKVLQEL